MSVPKTPEPQDPLQKTAKTPMSCLRKRLVDASLENYCEEDDPTFVAEEETEVSDSEDLISVISTDVLLSEETIDSVLTEEGQDLEKLAKTPPSPKNHESWGQWLVRHEVPRKALHSFMGFFTLWIYTLGISVQQSVLPILAITVLLFLNDFVRLRVPAINEKVTAWFGFILRKSEIHGYNGTLFYAAGVLLVFLWAPKDISVMSVLLLSWADTAALTIGRRYGRYTPQVMPGKSLAGCLASFATGVVVCYLFYGFFDKAYAHVNQAGDIFWTESTSKLNLHSYAFATGVIASISEAADIGGIDDNFIIPVASAVLLYGLVWATHL